MKCAIQLFRYSYLVMLFGLLFACNKNDPPPEVPEEPTGDAKNADTIFNHLQFFNAAKKLGAIPTGPAFSGLKINIRDTLYLYDLERPFKFLHEDTTKDVAGIYVQVRGHFEGGTNSTYYYDVPELDETAHNDTTTTILIGFDPKNMPDELTFTITITPYDPNGQPLATDSVPVVVKPPKVDPLGNVSECSIITAPGDYWDWEMSFIPDPDSLGEFLFLNSPDKVWGIGGQYIKGSCCNGSSVYGFCPGDSVANSELYFPTLFNYNEEIFKFIGGGEFVRLTGMLNVLPEPRGSDFCGTADGFVIRKFENVTYYGNWTINHLPANINGDSLTLTLQGTSSVPAGSGYGNPGGRIRILDCYLMVLIQPDMERPDRDLIKFYNYRNVDSPYWNPFG